MFSFGDLSSIGRFEVVASHDVVDVVDTSWSHSDFSEIYGPYTSIGIFGLILGEVGGIHMIVNVSISLIPFLVIESLVVMVSWMNGEMFSYPSG